MHNYVVILTEFLNDFVCINLLESVLYIYIATDVMQYGLKRNYDHTAEGKSLVMS